MKLDIMDNRKIWNELRVITAGKGSKMSVRKYRFYLLMITLVAVIAGTLVYLYYEEQEKSYREGTLVQKVYVIEEELA